MYVADHRHHPDGGLPDMMSASEGGGESWKSGQVWEVV